MKSKTPHPSMRGTFFWHLYDEIEKNKDIVVLTGDLGFGMLDAIREDFPNQFINCGASEQAMMDIAVGLAHSGKIPFVYSITPFLIRRAYETVKIYIDHEDLPIKLIGGGRDDDYKHDGFSHDATNIKELLDTCPNIEQFYPKDAEATQSLVKYAVNSDKPLFISLKR